MFLSEWCEFPSVPCLAGKKKLDDSSRLDVLKSRTSLTCFQVCFLHGRAKDLSAPGRCEPKLQRNLLVPSSGKNGTQEATSQRNLRGISFF